jgi:hypothetical protein
MMRRIAFLGLLLALSACGTYSTPAAVQISDGRQMVGTATAAMSGGTFHVSDGKGFSCDGTYDALDTSRDISAPVLCSDGRIGTISLHRTPDLLSGSGDFVLNDGTTGRVAFGKLAPSVFSSAPNAPTTARAIYNPPQAHVMRSVPAHRNYIRGPRGGCYYISGSGSKVYVDRSKCG